MNYKIAFVTHDNKIIKSKVSFACHENALRYVIARRIERENLNGAIIYKTRRYLSSVLSATGKRIFNFLNDLDWSIIVVQGTPPIIAELGENARSIVTVNPPSYEGYEIPSLHMVLIYTGALRHHGIYSVLLHEIGHIVVDLETKLDYDSHVLYHELRAWEWAWENAQRLNINNRIMRNIMRRCLSSYIYAESKLKGTGMPKDIFWKRVKKLFGRVQIFSKNGSAGSK